MARTLSQVLPPSTEVAARTALAVALMPRALAYTVPSGPIDTQGSDARMKGDRWVAQIEKGSRLSSQVLPPSNE
jgi:hypothetical protein